MSTIVAALDSSAAARPVLETALRLGEATASAVEAIHVGESSAEIPEALTTRVDVPLRLFKGPPERAILAVIDQREVELAVIGARSTPRGRRPVGRIARHILERTRKCVVVVPPEVIVRRPLRRILLPLEGTETTSVGALEALRPVLAHGQVQLVVLHVFTDTTLPRMLDRPGRDLQLLGREFLALHCPVADVIELCSGPVGLRVNEASTNHDADMIVLSWGQHTAADRAAVVREVLGSSALPVLLLPLDQSNTPTVVGSSTEQR